MAYSWGDPAGVGAVKVSWNTAGQIVVGVVTSEDATVAS